MKKLLYVCEADSGGIMEYAIRQSAAIARECVEVHFLCKPSFPVERLVGGVELHKFAPENPPRWAVGKLGTIWRLTLGQHQNAKRVSDLAIKLSQTSSIHKPLPVTRHRLGSAEVAVIFACYKEYFAPFWVGPFRRLAARGALIGTIAHDPVRDFVVGPGWWHRWSVRLGYSFVRHVFVHDDTPVDFGGRQPEGIQVHQIPHGPYEVAEPKIGRLEMRRRFGFLTADDSDIHGWGTTKITKEHEMGKAGLCLDEPCGAVFSNPSTSELARDSENTSLTLSASSSAPLPATGHSPLATPAWPDVVFLAFGQIRDGKNLDLFLWAMTQLPENVKLFVAGKGDSRSSRPPEYYQKLAEELGVAERCRWDIRRIPEEDVGDIFAACDVVLVTYSAKFRSASGVLSAAVSARKPVLASSGPGPLKKVVEKYHLGVFVTPDNPGEILKGAQMILDSLTPRASRYQSLATSTLLKPDWEKYEKENSWEENARNVRQAFES